MFPANWLKQPHIWKIDAKISNYCLSNPITQNDQYGFKTSLEDHCNEERSQEKNIYLPRITYSRILDLANWRKWSTTKDPLKKSVEYGWNKERLRKNKIFTTVFWLSIRGYSTLEYYLVAQRQVRTQNNHLALKTSFEDKCSKEKSQAGNVY